MNTIHDFILKTKDFSSNSKIWLFYLSSPILPNKNMEGDNLLKEFSKNWSAHGQNLKNDLMLIYNQILIATVDETIVCTTGCSIDSLNRWVNDIYCNKLDTTLATRDRVFYLNENSVNYISIENLSKLVDENPNILVSNLFYNNLEEISNNFWKKVENSHFKRYI